MKALLARLLGVTEKLSDQDQLTAQHQNYEAGRLNGYETGYTAGYNKGVATGVQREKDRVTGDWGSLPR